LWFLSYVIVLFSLYHYIVAHGLYPPYADAVLD
jgi:hypothetical protein